MFLSWEALDLKLTSLHWHLIIKELFGGFSLKPKKIKTSHLQYALLYKVDLETGKGEVVKEFNISNLGRGAGLEFSKETQKFYWSSAKGLYELNIKRGMAIKRLTFTKRGTFCLARNSEGNFMGIENNTLVEIDVLKKKITQKVKLNIPRSKRRVPSLLVLNDGKIFFSFKKKMYYMKDLNSKLVNLGPIDVTLGDWR